MPTDFNNNPLSTRTFNSRGEPTGGFGYINPTATPTILPAERTDRREVPVLRTGTGGSGFREPESLLSRHDKPYDARTERGVDDRGGDDDGYRHGRPS